ncbi:SMP-30/gluconolactonase/LRE family protein [Acidovorax sp. GBBC 3334]|uniref:SMP-30/gluconolactonase/LRE family protein n=1 Tax=unclassified Acidovorax TaxID=2684926 RepID=UPI002303E3E2|nr:MULTISPECIES: SMP-30/gluconolactonase/LRE family protein [unclassified Acidovorax]MDA8457315.1 SMP-30/gluconolactonase/LRE family protein [Acidovorax sp. GBBC 3334]MDA8521107.1 SMP-30/gluconolactonase/LRE family protein [Acidovorax sp. NCPPB 4044]
MTAEQASTAHGTGRRAFLGGAIASAAGAAAWPGSAAAQAFDFKPNQRYPDPAVQVLDPSFGKYRIFSSSVEQVATGLRWAEGPVWFGDGRYLLVSDIPNNRIVRWDEATGQLGVFRHPSNFANGLARDRQGRLLACEHLTRRITRTEYDGSITVLADGYNGKRFNSPNDIVCKSDGSVWFTDPPFGIAGHWEGDKAAPELPHSVYRIDPQSGKTELVLDDLAGPNGLCFSPDEQRLYIVESRAQPHRVVWAFDVAPGGKRLANKRVHINAGGPGALDGIKCDEDGNLWCGWGSNGSAGASAADLDGVMVFNPQGQPIGHIRLPERCANLVFGGAKRNRLFMASSHSIYALYVETRGAV